MKLITLKIAVHSVEDLTDEQTEKLLDKLEPICDKTFEAFRNEVYEVSSLLAVVEEK